MAAMVNGWWEWVPRQRVEVDREKSTAQGEWCSPVTAVASGRYKTGDTRLQIDANTGSTITQRLLFPRGKGNLWRF